MHTLGRNHLDFHNAGVVGVFDEDTHFSDESIYQYYFSIYSINPAFDFQQHIKDNNLNEIYDPEDHTGQIGGALQLFGDPESIPTRGSSPAPSVSGNANTLVEQTDGSAFDLSRRSPTSPMLSYDS